MNPSFWRRPVVLLTVSCILSLAAAAWMLPQLYVDGTFSHFSRHDPENGYLATFLLVGQWVHTEVALFDLYDHLSFAFNHLSTGIYTLGHALAALVFIVLSPFLAYPAEQFYWIYVFVFQAAMIVLRSVGIYLILRQWGLHPFVIGMTLLFLNTILSLVMHLGLLTTNVYSYLPLLMYFFWMWCERARLAYGLWFLLILTIAVANSPLFALGYFYLVLHFFMVSCVLYYVCQGQWRTWRAVIHPFRGRAWKRPVAQGALACVLILLPSVILWTMMRQDFYVPQSGLGDTQGRMANLFRPLSFFENPGLKDVAYLHKFPFEAVNYFEGLWENHWPLFGASVLLVSALGLFLSRIKTKWIWAMAVLAVLLSNTQVSMHLPLGIAHWITALTNPFHFLIRTLHMPALLLPVVFAPLVALGLQALWDIAIRCHQRTAVNRQNWAMGLLLVLMVYLSYNYFYYIKIYVLASCVAVAAFLYVASHYPRARFNVVLACATLIFIFAIDLGAAKVFAARFLQPSYLLEPRMRPTLDNQVPILAEYQNPLHLPFRRTLTVQNEQGDPVLHSNQALYGAYYKYYSLERFLLKPSLYNPLLLVYKDMPADMMGQELWIRRYVGEGRKVLGTVPYAICGDDPQRHQVVEQGLQQTVVVLEGRCDQLSRTVQDLAQVKPHHHTPQREHRGWDLNLTRFAQHEAYTEYRAALPKDFPKYAATSLAFSPLDQDLALSVNGRPARPMQGKLLRPYEFDVNNVRQGQLAVSLPKDVTPKAASLSLQWDHEIPKVQRFGLDHVSVAYDSPQSGWLVLHWPWDRKWSLRIDGERVPLRRANHYFMAAPISAGIHDVELVYWPGSFLRFLIPLSLLTSAIALVAAVRWAFQSLSQERNI